MLRRLLLPLLLLCSLSHAELRHGVAVSVNGQVRSEFSSCENDLFPLMSIIKFPLAIVVLHQVEQGKYSMEQSFELGPADMDAQTWSPLQKLHPAGGVFTLRELLHACLCQSDNNACNYLFSLAGGPQEVQRFFCARYGSGFLLRISRTERGMKDPRGMAENRATPLALLRLLEDVYAAARQTCERPILSAPYAACLLETMEQAQTGDLRLKAGLPASGIRFAHKTGSSGVEGGRTLAHHDVGIVMQPNGRHACVVSLITGSDESEEQMNRCHAATARSVYQLHLNGGDNKRAQP